MEERRKAVRHNLGDEGFIVANINGKELVIRVMNISPEGMRVRVPEPMEMGTEIFCKIDICPDTAPFYAQGSVVWIEKVNDKWEAGVKFFITRIYNFFNEK